MNENVVGKLKKKFGSNILSFSTLRVLSHCNLAPKVNLCSITDNLFTDNLCTITDNLFLLISFAVSLYLILKIYIVVVIFSYPICFVVKAFILWVHITLPFLNSKAVLIMISSPLIFSFHMSVQIHDNISTPFFFIF